MQTPLRLVARTAIQALARFGYEIRKTDSASDEALYAEYPRTALESRAFINIGAGAFKHRYWTNVDYASDWYASNQRAQFVNYNLAAHEPLPFAADKIELAYTSHTIEHVSNAAVANVFRECHRVLKPGGALRVTCPDARLLWRAVRHRRDAYWRWRAPWFSGRLSTAPSLREVTGLDYLVREVATARCRHYVHARSVPLQSDLERAFATLEFEPFMDWLVEGLEFDARYPGDHINWWDENKVQRFLHEAGFTLVESSRRGQSLFAPLTHAQLFDNTQPVDSLYVEAVKLPEA